MGCNLQGIWPGNGKPMASLYDKLKKKKNINTGFLKDEFEVMYVCL